MQRTMKRFLIILVILILTALASSCGIQGKPTGKIGVATTILPVADFIKNVGGDKVEVTVMVPPGANVHTYEPTPGQLKELAQARLYFMVGSGVEFELAWMNKIIQNNKQLEIIDCSRGVQLMAAEQHWHNYNQNAEKENNLGKDPHIWLSPKNAKIMVENICAGLIRIDPPNKDYYTQNKRDYLQKLDELDNSIQESLKGLRNRNFMVFHPAWGYFARDYDLKQIPVELAGKDPSVKDIADLIEQAKKK
ncbi:MAG: zinc ABC transporter substrate-binding protein, partial [Armatimonadetes bacterium]|nr:zinc ABC transporter substrate-binding protein [Armatimonadota bacterium]